MASADLVARVPFALPVAAAQPADLVVHAVADRGGPAAGLPVIFTVERGAFGLGSERAKSVSVDTDSAGRAAIAASMVRPGAGIVSASSNTAGGPIKFVLRTPGVTHTIDIVVEEPVSADDGLLRVRLFVRDIVGEPVRQASIVVSGYTMEDVAVRTTAIGCGPGVYEAVLPARHAGEWTILATDRIAHAAASRRIGVSPGKPVRIAAIASDPRREPPFGRADLRVRVEDAAGNALDPCGLEAAVDGRPLAAIRDGEGATFAVEQTGSGDVRCDLSDRRSGLTASAAVPFAHFWMLLPDLVRPGATYRGEVRVLPAKDRPLEKGLLTIGFDPGRVAFTGHHPPERKLVSLSRPVVSERSVSLEFKAERPIRAAEFPEGIELCEMEWTCKGEGTTCFDVGGAMSPDIPGWMLCMPQKAEIPNRQCICINIIYRSSRPQDRQVGYAMAAQIADVITDNIYECCPILSTRTHLGMIDESSEEWKEVTKDWIGTDPWDIDEIESVFNSGIGQRAHCLNLYVLDLGNTGLGGYTRRPSWFHNGAIAVDPEAFGKHRNVAAHEAGHALGLDHVPDWPGLNLMTPGGGRNNNAPRNLLSQSQCQVIWQNLNSYPC